jgi:sugar lactone lactonase YvrE
MKNILVFILVTSSVSLACGPNSKEWSTKEGLEQPESALFDPLTTHIFVSNVAGEPSSKDGRGWISRFNKDGRLLAGQWVAGLNAPKGLAVKGDSLWVSDVDQLVQVSIGQSKVVDRIAIEGAKFLNDVTIDLAGNIYVSDTLASRIYLVGADKKVTVIIDGADAESPDGLWVEGNTLFVAAWGYIKDFAESEKAQGNFYSLDLTTKKKTILSKKPLGNLDGIWTENSKNGFYLSDWIKGQVFFVSRKGWRGEVKGFKAFKKKGLAGAADLGFIADQKFVLVPSMQTNTLHALNAGVY